MLALNFAWVKSAEAVMGVADVTVTTTAVDIPRKVDNIFVRIAKIFLGRLRSKMITMLQNDLVNWVQNGTKPRFVSNPKKFMEQAADQAAVSTLSEISGFDVCSTFKPQLNFLVSKALVLPEDRVRCTIDDVVENTQRFAENFNNGGWQRWGSLHETQKTLPRSYIAATEF